jgi:hypothetical protein
MCPQLPPMGINNGLADRQPHSHSAALCGVKRLENALETFGINARPGIGPGHEDPCLVLFGADQQLNAKRVVVARQRFSVGGLGDPRLRVMMSMRSDFLGYLQSDKLMFAARQQIDVPPLREEELRERPSTFDSLIALRAFVGHSPPAWSAMASGRDQLSPRRLSNPGGMSGSAPCSFSPLSSAQQNARRRISARPASSILRKCVTVSPAFFRFISMMIERVSVVSGKQSMR